MTQLSIEGAGSARWLALWQSTGREPFAHPAYVVLEARDGARPVAVCWSDDRGEVLLPLLLRPLPEGPGLADLAGEWTDAVSPYGYGGPFVAGSPDLAAFVAALLAWMRDTKVLTGFVRAALDVSLPASGTVSGYESVHLADNVVVDLGRPTDDRWRHYDAKVRKNVNKARRHDLHVEVRDEFGDVGGFVAIYHDTMRRRDAAAEYYYPAEHFECIRDEMPGSYWVADVVDCDGRTVSTEVVLTGERSCYSYLGGTLEDAFAMAPNDLLKHDVIDHAAAYGLESYVLGGGFRPGDGIFRYKRAFDRDGVVPFHGVRLIAEPGLYRDVTAAHPGDPGETFFPSYRAPS